MINARETQNAIRNNSISRMRPETSRFGSSSQNIERFQRYLENRGCPVRLATPKTEDIRWLG